MFFEGVALLAVLTFIVTRVLKQDKWLGSLIQLGEVQQRETVHKEILQHKAELQAELKAAPAVAASPAAPAPHATTRSERLAFTTGIINIVLSAYLLGAFPSLYYLWYTPKAVVLIGLRWLNFRKRGTHYLLFDFCYFANGLLLAYVWLFPASPELFLIVFTVANGPLAWSILAFNQSLVLHNWQQITSVFIHTSPACITLGLRWYASAFAVCADWPLCSDVSKWQMLEVPTVVVFCCFWFLTSALAALADALLSMVVALLLRVHLCLYAGLSQSVFV